MAMSVEEYQERLRQVIQQAGQSSVELILVPAANALLANIKNRISREGRATNDGNIGMYSQRPAYFSKKAFNKKAAFKPQGKTGFTGEKIVSENKYKVVKVKLKDGRTIEKIVSEKKYKVVKHVPKSMYLAQGYFQFRGIQGLDNSKVNLFYTGDLMASYVLQVSGQSVFLGFDKESKARLRKILEQKKYKMRIFSATPDELEEYNKEVEQALIDVTRF